MDYSNYCFSSDIKHDKNENAHSKFFLSPNNCADLIKDSKAKRCEVLKKLGKSMRSLMNQNSLKKGSTMNKSTKRLSFTKNDKNIQNEIQCKMSKAMPHEGILFIQVIDSGCGISESDLKNLFKPYAQANKEVYSKHGGTGLGLWISQQLIKAMNGSIKCTSIIGKGTTFTIEIPVKCKNSLNENVFFHNMSIF